MRSPCRQRLVVHSLELETDDGEGGLRGEAELPSGVPSIAPLHPDGTVRSPDAPPPCRTEQQHVIASL
ncbi:MAG: hypothetical protein JW751_29300 [Polyangiaceae bacterium]|nr:hypothetical protein [Polyangiaceae bacterium]